MNDDINSGANATNLYNVNFVGTFVNLFNTYNVRVVKLAHNKNFIAELLQPFGCINETQIKTLCRVFDSSGPMCHESNNTTNSRSKNRAVQYPHVDFFYGCIKGCLQSKLGSIEGDREVPIFQESVIVSLTSILTIVLAKSPSACISCRSVLKSSIDESE